MKNLIKHILIFLLDPCLPFLQNLIYRVKYWEKVFSDAKERRKIKIPRKITKLLQQKKELGEKIKLHLGCGTVYKTGWINIDNNSDHNIQKIDLLLDLSRGIPFPDSSVDFIFNEHFLEHLSLEDGLFFLKECKRVLKTGGMARISMPNLKSTVRNYCEGTRNDPVFFDKYQLHFIKTGAQYLNVNFRFWGHSWLYDEEELLYRLKEAGFRSVKFYNFGVSDIPEFKDIESRPESDLIAEAIKQKE